MTPEPRRPLVFFHAGLGKVASTYLQKRVFPALEGICYIPRDRFRSHARIVARAEHDRYLISRECGKRLQPRLEEIHRFYPDARILLFFRRHDEWIASHYRRYVKNGGVRDLDGYLDLDGDDGIWTRDQLEYMPMIERVRQRFGRDPFVLTYDRLRADGDDFNRRLADYLGATIDPSRLRTEPVHASYAVARLARLRRINRHLGLAEPEIAGPTGGTRAGHRRLRLARSYLLLGAAGLLKPDPDPHEALTPRAVLERIREYYADDWRSVVAFEAAQFDG